MGRWRGMAGVDERKRNNVAKMEKQRKGGGRLFKNV
jgi:hypothetical protein